MTELGLLVLDDEEFFTGFDQAELPTGDLFDGGRIFKQPACLFGEPGVFFAVACDGGCQLPVLAAHAQHRQQPAVAGKGVEDDHRSCDKQQCVHYRAAARAAAALRTSPGGVCSDVAPGHRAGTVPQFSRKYNS